MFLPWDAGGFLDGGLRMVSWLVARVSGKVDIPGRTEAAPVGRTIAYCRVSSRDQNPQLQPDALHAHGYDQLFAEKQSGKHGAARPEFARALTSLQAGDTLVFWKSDRWGRSAAHVLTVGQLRDRGVTGQVADRELRPGHQGRPVHVRGPGRGRRNELELRAERQADGIAAARRRQAAGTMLPGKKHIGRPLWGARSMPGL